jgi:uncharacterized MnhB-related membrane protein
MMQARTCMSILTSDRYAAVFTQAVQPVLPPWLFKLLSTAIRLTNNVVGGMSFVRSPPT